MDVIPRFAGHTLIWLVTWIASWKVFYGPLARRRINYVDRFALATGYFLALSILVVLAYRNKLGTRVVDFTVAPFIVLAAAFGLQILAYHVARTFLRRPAAMIENNPYEFFLRLDYRYLFSKSFEVLYQQVMIVLLVLIIGEVTERIPIVMALYAAVFALGHLPLLRLFGPEGHSFGLFYAVLAVLSAAVFPPLILEVPYGFVYTYTIHSVFYTLLALWFWAGKHECA